MRRQDKKIAMKKANMLFEQRCNESAFSWDGKYANEEDIDEAMFLGDDMETIEETEEIEEDCGCLLNQPEPTDVESSQWFSDEHGERITDMELD